MDFVFEFSGGLGKNIMFTSFVKWVNEKFPDSKITVISPYPELFEYNPRIYRNLPVTQSYLFADYIQGNDFRKGDPYTLFDYYREENKEHFCTICPIAFGFGEYNEKFHNEIFLTNGERIEFSEMEKKNVITIQPFGGTPNGLNFNAKDKIDSSENERDIPMDILIKIVTILKKKGYEVIQVRGQTDPQVPGTTQLLMPFRNFVSLGIHCKGHIGIDSSFMHAMAAFDKPQMIFWGQTNVDNLGYKYPGVLNVFKEGAMKCIPHVSMPDVGGVFPRRDLEKAKNWEYSDKELEDKIDEFIKLIE